VAQVTLIQVVSRAIHDEQFFQDLQRSVADACAAVGWELKPEDADRLTKALKNTPEAAKFDLPQFISAFHHHEFPLVDWFAVDWFKPNPFDTSKK